MRSVQALKPRPNAKPRTEIGGKGLPQTLAPRARILAPLHHDVIVIGASAGGVSALRQLVAALPPNLRAAILLVLHIGPRPSVLPTLLEHAGSLPAMHGRSGQPLRPGRIYVAPPGRHMTVRDGHIRLNSRPPENYTRPAIDPLFRSAAHEYGARVIGVVLTGCDSDGTRGLVAIKAAGGTCVIQKPADAAYPDMPRSALYGDSPDYCVPLDEMAPLLVNLVAAGRAGRTARSAAGEGTSPDWGQAPGFGF